MADWHAGDVRFLPPTQLGERYRRYRLPDPDAETAMTGSVRRYGQQTPLVVCLREETYARTPPALPWRLLHVRANHGKERRPGSVPAGLSAQLTISGGSRSGGGGA